MDMHIKQLGNIDGNLEASEQIGDGRVRLTIFTRRFGRFVIAVTKEEHEMMSHPTPPAREQQA